MSWRTISISNVRVTPQEQSALDTIAGAASAGAEVLENVVAEFRGAISSAGGPLGPANTVPDVVRLHVINRTRWLWLCEFPQLKAMQTEARKTLNDAAEKMLGALSEGKQKVEPPDTEITTTSPIPGPSIDPKCRRFDRCDEEGI